MKVAFFRTETDKAGRKRQPVSLKLFKANNISIAGPGNIKKISKKLKDSNDPCPFQLVVR